ncbi:MAG: DUF3105 domain-containing protein [Acidimicrobiales bacterium]
MAPHLRTLLAGLAIGFAVAGCGGSSAKAPAAAACGAVVPEALDSNLGHVLPGAPEPTYLTDPPTSGPHAPGAAPTGAVDAPLTRPVQVGLLEAGGVLVQYRDAADLDWLRPLATGSVVVAPNPDLADRVVATAWLYKQSCSGQDADALGRFAVDHAGHGPDGG